MSKTAVIIPAAGSSSRFGGKVKKPFAILDGRAVFLRTLELFINREDVCQTILCVSPDDMEMVRTKFGANLGFMGVKVVQGGKERYETVKLAIAEVDSSASLIAVHDAVRPCVSADQITEVFQTAEKTGAAILGTEVTATLKRVKDKYIEETVDRNSLYMALTPQVFKADVLRNAYDKLPSAMKHITDDAQVVELTGHKVSIVPCDPTNIKVTVASDIKLAEAILKILPKPKVKGPSNPFEEVQW